MLRCHKLSLLALCLCVPCHAQVAGTGVAVTGPGSRESAVLARATHRVWDLADAGRVDEALTVIEAVRKLTTDPQELARLDAIRTVCLAVQGGGSVSGATATTTPAVAVSVDEALTAIAGVRKLTADPIQVARLEAMKSVCTTLKEAGPAPAATVPPAAALAAAPLRLPPAAAPVEVPSRPPPAVALAEVPSRPPAAAEPRPQPAVTSLRAVVQEALAPPRETVPATVSRVAPAAAETATRKPVATERSVAHHPPADFNRMVDRAWEVTRAGRVDEGLALVEQARKGTRDPQQLATLDAMKTAYTTLRNTCPAPTQSAAPVTVAPAEFLRVVDRAWELARAGRLNDAVALVEQTRKHTQDVEQLATLDTMKTAYTTLRDTPPPPAKPATVKAAAPARTAAAASAPTPATASAASVAPADRALPKDVDSRIQRAWELARAGQPHDAFIMIEAAWEQAENPAEIAKLENARRTFMTMRETQKAAAPARTAAAASAPTPATASAASVAPADRALPKDVDSRIQRAWELARAGQPHDAFVMIEAAWEQAENPAEIAKLENARRSLMTMRETPATAAAPEIQATTTVPQTVTTAPQAAATVPEAAAAVPQAAASETASPLWDDPRFREQFVGSYAMTAAVEPKTSDDERKVLSAILDLMSKGNPDAALAMVEKLFLPEPPALEELGIATLAMERQEAAQAAAAEAEAAAAKPGKTASGKTHSSPGRLSTAANPTPSLYGSVRGLFGGSSAATGVSNQAATAATPAGADSQTPAGSSPPRTVLQNPSASFAFIAGNICLQKGDLDAAAAWYGKAVEIFPSFMRAHKNAGMVSVRRGDNEAAVKSLTRALELGANEVLVYGLLGYAYSALGNHMSAETSYRMAVLLQPQSADWKLGLVRALFGQSRFAEAAAVCGQLIADGSRDAGLWRLQANAYLALDKPLLAAQNYEYLRLRGEADLESLNRLGDIYMKEKMLDTAVAVYTDALARFPDQAPERALRNAKVLAMSGSAAEANQFLGEVRTRFGDRLSADQKNDLLRLQARIASSAGDDAQQAKILQEIVALNPSDGEALLMLGDYHVRNAQAEEAIVCFERAAEVKGTEAKGKLRHAQLLVKLSKYQEAIPLLQVAQRLQHRDDVAEYLKQVEAAAAARR